MALSRVLTRYSRVKPTISFYSRKNRCMQYCESFLESDACLIREFDPNIVAYLTQPESFGYPVNGRLLRYTPDCLVKTRDRGFYYDEVKPITRAEV